MLQASAEQYVETNIVGSSLCSVVPSDETSLALRHLTLISLRNISGPLELHIESRGMEQLSEAVSLSSS